MDFMGPFQGRTQDFFRGGGWRSQNRLLYVRDGLFKKAYCICAKYRPRPACPKLVRLFAICKFSVCQRTPYDSVDCYKKWIELWIPRYDSFIRFKNYNLRFPFFECRNHYRHIIVMVRYMRSTEMVH